MKKIIGFAVIAVIAFGLWGAADSIAWAQQPATALEEAVKKLTSKVGDNDGRLAYHIDSWTSLAIILTSLLIAVMLNHARPNFRVFGTLLAALGCLGITAWFGVVYASGIVTNPRPIYLPVDVFKPTLLTLQALASFIAGVFLLFVTRWQARRADHLVLETANSAERYGLASRYFHWVIAILILVLIPMGIFASMIPEHVWYRQGYYVAHKTIGLMVLILALGRLAWHIRVSRPPLAAALKVWERRLAHSAHILLYVFMIGFPVSGFIMSTYGGKLSHFFIWDTPLLWAPDKDAIIPFALMHKVVLPYLFYIVFGAHILGALKHQFYDKHKTSFARIVS